MLSQKNQRPITVEVKIHGVPLHMELDTGATVSVIRRQQLRKLKQSLKLEPTELRTYTGETPCAVFKAAVQCKDQVADFPLYVVDYGGPALLGREWLETFRLDWDEISGLHKLCNDSHPAARKEDRATRLRGLLDKYSTIFEGTFGKIEGEQATVFLKDKRPKFLKARNMPYALRSAVEEELRKLQEIGLITQVSTSEFATPIVPAVKKDGTIRVCGDYKTTLNPVLYTEQYPLPRLGGTSCACRRAVLF